MKKTSIPTNAEMSQADHELLLKYINRKQPQKILEIGVSAGGTTCLLLDVLPKSSTLYSIDLLTTYFRDPNKPVGFEAISFYDKTVHAEWITIFGKDIADCIVEIGEGIDFVVLDTVHTMPGEFLSFLAILPYMEDNAVLILHDIGLHALYKTGDSFPNEYLQQAYCTSLLHNSIVSPEKEISKAYIPNCAAIILNKKMAMENISSVMNMLFVNWAYMPPPEILESTLKIIKEHYSADVIKLYESAVDWNIKLAEFKAYQSQLADIKPKLSFMEHVSAATKLLFSK